MESQCASHPQEDCTRAQRTLVAVVKAVGELEMRLVDSVMWSSRRGTGPFGPGVGMLGGGEVVREGFECIGSWGGGSQVGSGHSRR